MVQAGTSIRPRVCLAALLCVASSGLAGAQVDTASPERGPAAPLSPRTVSYGIDVTFDPERKTLLSQQVMSWRNDTGAPVDTLYFHLYLNAFRNTKSTFMTESGGSMRGEEMADDGWGFVEIESVRRISGTTDGLELVDGLTFIQPDDGNPHDRTLARLPLAGTVAPGETVTLELGVRAKLPHPFARTGAIEGFALVGQWFPKLVKWDRDHWNLHQFHATSEFFADFGTYDVCINLPSDHVVGATGIEVSRTSAGANTTHCYRAEDVHDFAWTASPELVEFTGTSREVAIRALVHRDRVGLGPRHVEAAAKALGWFEDNIGDYPFPNLTVVDPKTGAEGARGMEYPTLITAGSSYRQHPGDRSLEHVILHELGHNFWYHLLASNEFEESWLDEGINSYTDIRAMEDLYGAIIERGPLQLSYLEVSRAAMVLRPSTDPILTRSWDFLDARNYGVNSYAKPGVVLETLRNLSGPERFDRALRDYATRWRFRHPRTEDFIASFEESLGEDLSEFFDQALRSTAVVDYAVTKVLSTVVEEEGFDFDREVDDAFSPAAPASSEAEESDITEEEVPAAEADETPRYRNVVVVQRRGDFVLPVEVTLHLDDGSTQQHLWNGKQGWLRLDWEDERRVEKAEVDAERKIPLDVNLVNNSRTREPGQLGINRLVARSLFLIQNLFELVGW